MHFNKENFEKKFLFEKKEIILETIKHQAKQKKTKPPKRFFTTNEIKMERVKASLYYFPRAFEN